MILTEKVFVNVAGKTKKHYEELGYKIPTHVGGNGRETVAKGTMIEVNVSDLPKNSHVEILVKCDKCGKEVSMTYQRYMSIIDKFGDYLCEKCKDDHMKITLQEKYNVDNVSQLDFIKKKKEETLMEHYNVTNPMKSKEIQDKAKQTNIERYGEECIFQTDEFKNNYNSYIENKYGSLDNFYKQKHETVVATNNERYGVDWYTQTDEYKERYKQTCLDKYGVEHALQNPEIKNKAKQTLIENHGEGYFKSDEFKEKFTSTMLERTGYMYPSQNPETKELIKKTNYEKYGGWYASTDEFKERFKQTCLDRYGVETPMQNPEIAQKVRDTMMKNGNVPTSAQQLYLHNLYGGILNHPFNYYSLDIYNPENNIVVEYSGGGHRLSVIHNNVTEEEFNHKEIIKYSYIKNAGMKLIEIITPHDLLPSDEVLMGMYDFAEKYFNETSHTWIQFFPEEGKYMNACNKETGGEFFDYGELRKINKEEVADC